MKRFITATALSLVAGSLAFGSAAFAQQDHHDNGRPEQNGGPDHHDNGHKAHPEWKKGHKMDKADWGRGQKVDYRQHKNLRKPPKGYEWREVDGNYVLAAVATGLIASIILSN
ncbi:MAG: RcnB family protein [Asticcacaulis sp.]|uniref:RcnB family protein n=1 Tax=Asticcacaulis sp. TaxID=1872648 RepID=UPI0039E2A5BC